MYAVKFSTLIKEWFFGKLCPEEKVCIINNHVVDSFMMYDLFSPFFDKKFRTLDILMLGSFIMKLNNELRSIKSKKEMEVSRLNNDIRVIELENTQLNSEVSRLNNELRSIKSKKEMEVSRLNNELDSIKSKKDDYKEYVHKKNTRVNRQSKKYRNYVRDVTVKDVVCQCCGAKDTLHVHHILPVNMYPAIAEDVNNGILLCESCHRKYHSIYGNKSGVNLRTLITFLTGGADKQEVLI